MAVLPRSCERARSRVSLSLDDELSELEEAMLHAHNARCAVCAAFEADVGAITHRLRLAPLEPLLAPVALPPHRRTIRRFAQVGAAAAVAVLAAGIGTLFSSSPTGGSTLSAPVAHPPVAQLSLAYLDAPRGLPQHPPITFRPRVGLETGRADI